MSSQECEYEGCTEPTKGKYCPEHQADYDDAMFDAMKDDRSYQESVEHCEDI